MIKHKWHDEIVAWANGAEIEIENGDEWEFVATPFFFESDNFRIKQQPKQSKYLYVYEYKGEYSFSTDRLDEREFDGVFVGRIEVQE